MERTKIRFILWFHPLHPLKKKAPGDEPGACRYSVLGFRGFVPFLDGVAGG